MANPWDVDAVVNAPAQAAPTAPAPWSADAIVAHPAAPMAHAAPAPASQPNTLADVGKSAWGGLVSSVGGMVDQVNPFAMVTRAAENVLANTGHPVPTSVQAFLPGGAQQATAAVGGAYQPKTTPGRYAGAVAGMVPNAFMGPEGITAKIASVVGPGLVSQGAADVASAAGAPPWAQTAARAVGGMLGGVATGGIGARMPQLLTPEEQPAARAIQAALDVTGAHRDDVKAAMAGGALPVAATPGLAQLGETVATLPGAGKATLQDAIGARMATQADRTMDALHQHLGINPQTAQGNVDSIVQAGREAAAPQYDALRANSAPVWNSALANLAQRPAIKKAIGVVSNNMLNSGQNPTTAGFAMDPDTGWQLPKTLDNVEQQPTAATWIGVHQALGQTVDRNPITGRALPNSISPGNTDIAVAGRDLKNSLTSAIPGYSQALATSGDYLSTSSAFERAQGTLFSGPVNNFRQMWSSLGSPSEQQAARAALANDVLEKADRGAFLPGQFKSPGVQKKLQIAFGADGATAFANQMEADLAERNTYNGVLSNSRTAGRQALVANYAANQPKAGGIMGAAGNVVGALKWGQAAVTAPHMLPAMLAEKVIKGGRTAAANAPPAWENPTTNAALGSLLSDPHQMAPFLDRMASQGIADYRGAQAQKVGLANLPRYMMPGLIGGLAGPGPGSP